MDPNSTLIPISLSDGSIIKAEVSRVQSEKKVSFAAIPLADALDKVKDFSVEVANAIGEIKEQVAPDKVSVKFGLEISGEPGAIAALLVKGSGKANFEITLEWG